MGIYSVYYSDREREQKKRPVRGFWLLLLLFLVRGGVSGGLGGSGPSPKNWPPKNWVSPPSSFLPGPSLLHLLAMWVCVSQSSLVLPAASLEPQLRTLRQWGGSVGIKTYRAAAFFPGHHFLQYKSTFLGAPKNLKKIKVVPVGVCETSVKEGVWRSYRLGVKN